MYVLIVVEIEQVNVRNKFAIVCFGSEEAIRRGEGGSY
jgi:hypothetical protein